MKINIGTTDRKVRLGISALAVIAAIILFAGGKAVLGVVALVVAAVMFGTSRMGFCPLYLPIGLDTSKGEAR